MDNPLDKIQTTLNEQPSGSANLETLVRNLRERHETMGQKEQVVGETEQKAIKGGGAMIAAASMATILSPALAFAEEGKGLIESGKELYHGAKAAKELAEKGAGWWDGIATTLSDWRLLVGTHSPEGAVAFGFLFLGLVTATALVKKANLKTFLSSLIAARVAVLVAELSGNQEYFSYAWAIPPLAVALTLKWWRGISVLGFRKNFRNLFAKEEKTAPAIKEEDEGSDDDDESDEGAEDETKTPAPAPIPSTPTHPTMNCPHCGQTVEQKKRCNQCGKPLDDRLPPTDEWGLGF
ncbi:hypothetical protein JXA05_04595 [Candidatus Peregrinibacteria bacterium]|nr:hypothetical protein [Candidatus Peregrinibacteria bacterium]